jgi:tetratricopeptide (TPR) repeat protein
MSQLLDSLRTVQKPKPARAAARPRTIVVLTGLGLAPRKTRKVRSVALIVAALLTVASAAAGALVWRPVPGRPSESSRPAGAFAQAVAFQQAGDYVRAIELYEMLLARDELPAESHNNLGLIHQQRGQLEDAARQFESSLAHDPAYAPAHYNLGVLYDRSGDRGRAAGHYRAFLEHRGHEHARLTPDVTARLAALGAPRVEGLVR